MLSFRKKRRYKKRAMNKTSTIAVPIMTTSDCSAAFISIEKPKRIKKKVRIKNELSAVSECSKLVVSSTLAEGNSKLMRLILTRAQLFMSKPKTRMMIREGNPSNLPPSYKMSNKAKMRKNRILSFDLVMMINNITENSRERKIARR